MNTVEERLRQRIRNTFADITGDLSGSDLREFEDTVLALIRAYGTAKNGTKDTVFETGVDEMRRMLHRRAVVHTGHSMAR